MIEAAPTAANIEGLLRQCAEAAPYPRLDHSDWGFRECHRLVEELRARGEIEAVYSAMSHLLDAGNGDEQWLAMNGLPHDRLMGAGFAKIDPSMMREEGQRVYRSLLAVLLQAGEMPYDISLRDQQRSPGGESLFGVYLGLDHAWFLEQISTLLGPDLNEGKVRLLLAMNGLSREEVERFRAELSHGETGLSLEWVETLLSACDSHLNYAEAEYNSAVTSPRF